jgi:diguanylate cyclase (GGDEF)-like protein
MQFPDIPKDEAKRVADLRALELLNTVREPAFDRITSLAAKLFQAPTALITLIDEYEQWLKSVHGGGPFAPISPRDTSFCGHTILHDEPMVVEDATKDPRFHDNPSVLTEPYIRFYAGAPITTESGSRIGAVCIIDHIPRMLTLEQRQVLVDLASIAKSEIELREIRKTTRAEFNTLRATLDHLPNGVVLLDEQFRCKYANRALLDMFHLHKVEDLMGWSSERAANYVATITDTQFSPDDWINFEGAGSVMVLKGEQLRVVRRTIHKLPIADTPFMALWSDITQEAEEIARMGQEALTDHLTGLANRQAGTLRMAQLLAKGPMSVVMFDIDHFKRVNDTYGHPVGDVVLKLLSNAVRMVAREDDLVCRWGGEEFMVFLDGSLETAQRFAERARIAVESLETPAGPITISLGVARGDHADVLQEVDQQLYRAKAEGRNRVCCSGV